MRYYTFLLLAGLIISALASCGTTPDQVPEEEILSVETTGGDTTAQVLELEFKDLDMPERYYLVFRQELSVLDMNGFLAMESKALETAVAKAGIQPTGPPVSLFYGWDTDRGWGDAAVAVPVPAGTKLPPYVLVTLPATKSLMLSMDGSYQRLSVMHYSLNEEINTLGYVARPPSVEEYVVGPNDSDDPSEFKTRIYYSYESNDL
jgi:effector-binding domain-containing protein